MLRLIILGLIFFVMVALVVRWRGASRSSAVPPLRFSRAEAYQILGVTADSNHIEIEAAYKRLIAKLHPDKGGSDWIAARLNAARDMLLK